MNVLDIILIGFGLSMDAFAVSVINGMTVKKNFLKMQVVCAFMFGVFQGAMPFFGWLLSGCIADFLKQVPHWIALIILSFLGVRMIVESFQNKQTATLSNFCFKMITVQAIATSVDALAVGVSFSGLGFTLSQMAQTCGVIAGITFVLCLAGCLIGRYSGNLLKQKAGIAGGFILVAIGIKIFIENII